MCEPRVNAMMAEESRALLSELVSEYHELQESNLKNLEPIEAGFNLARKFGFWEFMKSEFLDMQLFDILIGKIRIDLLLISQLLFFLEIPLSKCKKLGHITLNVSSEINYVPKAHVFILFPKEC